MVKCQGKTGEASKEAAAGLDAAHHVMFELARAEFEKGIDKDPNCVTCYLNKAHVEQDRVLKRELLRDCSRAIKTRTSRKLYLLKQQ